MDTRRICPICQAENPTNARYCQECGTVFDGKETGKVARQWLEEILKNLSSHIISPPPETIVFQLVGRSEPLLIEVKDRMIIGRNSGGSSIPDINLTVFQASMQGVSRHHAAILLRDENYFIEDLASTNGTWINENLLRPHQPYLLNSGDLLRLGQLVLFIHFSTVKITVE